MATHTNIIFLAFNEDGDITADTDRDAAVDRLRDEFGGEHCRVVEMTVTLPVLDDMKASFAVPADKAETVEVKTT